MINLTEILTKINQVAEELPKEEETQQLIVEHSFLFLMEQLLKELENMRKLILKACFNPALKAHSKNKDNMI